MKQIILAIILILISTLGFGQALNMKSGKGDKAQVFVNDQANCQKSEALYINIGAACGDLDNMKSALTSSLQKSNYKITTNSDATKYTLEIQFMLVGKFGGGFLYQGCSATLTDKAGEILMTIEFEEKLSKAIAVEKITEQMNKVFK